MSLTIEEARELAMLLDARRDQKELENKRQQHACRVRFNPKQRKRPSKRPRLKIVDGLPLKSLSEADRQVFIEAMSTAHPNWKDADGMSNERRSDLTNTLFRTWLNVFLQSRCDCSTKQVTRLGHNCGTRYEQFDWDYVIDAVAAANEERDRRRPWFLKLATVNGAEVRA